MNVRQGRYREGFEFTRTKQVLGSGNSAGDIVVIKDSQTGEHHALKTVSLTDRNFKTKTSTLHQLTKL